jgi:hypothetical protein
VEIYLNTQVVEEHADRVGILSEKHLSLSDLKINGILIALSE